MVMKRNAMRKNLTQSIWKSLGRYIAIVMIIALGASMFVGLLMTKTDMVATGQKYMEDQNMFDLRLVSSYGWDLDDLDAVRQFPGIQDAEGMIYLDALARLQGRDTDKVFRFYNIPEQINLVSLRGGRMPERPDECLIDGYFSTDEILGSTITISADNKDDTQDAFVHKTYTIVGYVATPLYMDMNRGTTSVGNGSIETYLFLPRDAFDVDYYTEIQVTIPGGYYIYTDAYNDAMDREGDRLEPLLRPIAEQRYHKFKNEANQAYNDGMLEYYKGLKEFKDGKAEAKRELEEGYNKLKDAEKQLAGAEGQIYDGAQQLADAKEQIEAGEKELEAGKQQFQEQRDSMYAPVIQSQTSLEEQKAGIEAELAVFKAQLEPVEAELAQISAEFGAMQEELTGLNRTIPDLTSKISNCDSRIRSARVALNLAMLFPKLNADTITALEAEIAEQEAMKAQYQAEHDTAVARREELNAILAEPTRRQQELENERDRIRLQMWPIEQRLNTVQGSLDLVLATKAVLDAQFAQAEEELLAAEEQLREGWEQIRENEQKLNNARAQLAQGRREIEEGWKEYEEGKIKAEQELADAEAKLAEAKEELRDAKNMIRDMTDLSLHILDRNSNIGYGSLDSASDIVQGVSRVFPAFFLLVAALVCITTMTRMIDEERTQIGTLKALGYSNAAIISKYRIYAGSGALVGCGLGVAAGSAIFPTILWQAYKIMLYITDGIVLTVNWWLCGAVVFAYTAVMLLVTWYCCRRTLEEQPAELIRPKAPDPGKKILLEHLKIWNRLSFLNKVTIRNIFRYRQRLAMMMVGIGGCTALLLTGFGLRDSIVNVVNYQFEDVTLYDLQVYFGEDQTDADQAEFQDEIRYGAEKVQFYNQQSVELEFGNQTREIYMMISDSAITELIDFHNGKEQLPMPGTNEVLLSIGVAEAMGVDPGDVVHLRNADMETLELTVTGLYENHVENYAIVTPGTIEAQWNRTPTKQMALIQLAEGQDAHALAAEIAGMLDVMNVTVCADLADMVGNMMDALDLVVWVVVVCAGLLAAVVLYNLTNININERIREIATIKVLGFNAGETGAYVFKENMTLTVVGSVLGLGLGYLLLLFVMSQVKINMVWFKAMITPLSYVLSIVLTIVAACIVDFVFYFKLDKINMAEALKSVE